MSDLVLFTEKGGMRQFSRAHRAQARTIGFVPTMGYLHEGHLSLVKLAKEAADIVVVSIYVNPTQFAAHEDFDVYPRDDEGDMAKLRQLGVHAVFKPGTLYDQPNDTGLVVGNTAAASGGHQTYVTVEQLQTGLCGKSRPHFFRGVATVVCKLFHIVEPDIAVFGKKDYQQWRIIQQMVNDLDMDISIIGGDIGRESDGLAMSSRNALLPAEQRAKAPCIRGALVAARHRVVSSSGSGQGLTPALLQQDIAQEITAAGGVVDYVEVVAADSLAAVEDLTAQPVVIAVAAFFGRVRLIDNIEIGSPQTPAC